jgi:hypothetical protein
MSSFPTAHGIDRHGARRPRRGREQSRESSRMNATAIRDSKLAIYLEFGDDDLVNAHDGVEFLHPVGPRHRG